MTTVEVVADPGSPPAVVKRARPGRDAARLAHEAEVLDEVRGPGVVDLLGFRTDAEGAELRLAWAGQHTLATIGTVATSEAAHLVAALAESVARLHELQIAHTRLTADHVVLALDQRPLLCGFSRACRGDPRALESDVVALGDLLALLVGTDAASADIVPERRSRLVRSEPERAALLTLADRASARGLSARPTAATFAETMRGLVPDARRGRGRGGPEPRRVALVLGGLVGTGLLLAGAYQVLGEGAPSEPSGESPTAAPSTDQVAPVGGSDAPSTAAPSIAAAPTVPSPTAPPVTAPVVACDEAGVPAADVDGDGCPDAYAVRGSQVTLDGRTYEVGEQGDLVALGDWNCDGRATAALVRPSTGEVFVFAEWASTARAITERPVAVVDGAAGVRPSRPDERCPDLVVTRQNRAPVAVQVRR